MTMTDRPTPDQHAEKVLAAIAQRILLGNGDEIAADARASLAALLALAKQGEAYEQHLASARSLYGEQDPSTEELAKKIRPFLAHHPYDAARKADAALSELVIRAQGHVPVEVLAAAETAREQAEKERDEAVNARDAMLAMMEAEPPPQIVDEITRQTIGDLAADRDRLAAALDAIAFNAESWHAGEDGKARALAVIAKWARDPGSIPAGVGEALNPGDTTQEQA